MVNKLPLGWFVDQKLQFSCYYKSGPIHSNHCCQFGNTVLNQLTSEADLLNKSSFFAAAVGAPKFITIIAINLVTLCSTA
jgi:hypothetical protein